MERLFTGISVVVALLGLGIGWLVFTRNPLKTMPSILENKYYVDEFYEGAVIDPVVGVSRGLLWKIIDVRIIDGIVNGVATVFGVFASILRQSQTGYARGYAAAILLGAVVVVGFFLLR
jgi:NADH:ubiquinone oxidoreductase subunit 5 (chain L)/Multisubunit Na+/H+ antiporter, MnhA subunit